MDAGQLRTLLKQCGLSQRGAAKALDINERTMRRYVSGKAHVPRAVELALLGMRKKDMLSEREKYEAIIADMTKLLELQQKSEGVVIDMIAVAVKAEREACAKLCEDIAEEFAYEPLQPDPGYCADAIRARGDAKPYATQAAMVESQTQGRMQIDPATGDVSIGAIRARKR